VSTTGPSGFFVVFASWTDPGRHSFAAMKWGRVANYAPQNFGEKPVFIHQPSWILVHHFLRWLQMVTVKTAGSQDLTLFLLYNLIGGWYTYPYEKWWSESQWEGWHPIYYGKWKMFQTTNQTMYISLYIYILLHITWCVSLDRCFISRGGPFCKSLDVQKHWTCCPTMGTHNPRIFW